MPLLFSYKSENFYLELEMDSKCSKTLFRPNNICLWVEIGWLPASLPSILEFCYF